MDITAVPVLEILLLAIVFLSLLVEVKTGGLGAVGIAHLSDRWRF